MLRIFRVGLFLSLLSFRVCTPLPVLADDTNEAIPRNVEQGKNAIEIPRSKSDAEISSRLQKVLGVTGWFTDLKVSSNEGVVFLQGTASEAGQRDWAQSLAKETDGVVAVINNLQLSELGWLDLSPAHKELKSFWKNTITFIPYLTASALVLLGSFFLYRISKRGIRKVWSYRTANPILVDVLSFFTTLPILLVGIYLVLKLMGLTGLALTLVGGTGAAGLVAGFAFKNILENYFSGIMLSVRKPFVIGDIIDVAGQSGVVFKITTRGTTLVDFDGNHVLIPNALVYTNIIKNHSINPITRTKLFFQAPAEADQKLTSQSIRRFLESRPEIVKDPVMDVNFASGKVEVSIWVDSRKTNVEKLKSILATKIEEGLSSGQPINVEPRSAGVDQGSTDNNVREILRNAESHQPVKNTGRELISESRL